MVACGRDKAKEPEKRCKTTATETTRYDIQEQIVDWRTEG